MADKVNEFGQPVFLRSPREASRVFGYDRADAISAPAFRFATAPRPKFLFYVNFVKNQALGPETNDDTWRRGMGFAVKSIDRPQVQPESQELNQYNKKRLVYTTVKYMPVNITLFDTVDSNLARMWSEYSQWYFGDFRHGNLADGDWSYDITTPLFNDNAGQGYGFSPQMSPQEPDQQSNNINKPYFFNRIEVYQFYSQSFVRYDLINPKITSFAPDEFDYENNQSASIRLTLAYEAVIYLNNANPLAISTSEVASSLFGAGDEFDGDTITLASSGSHLPRHTNTSTSIGASVNPLRLQTVSEKQIGTIADFNTPPQDTAFTGATDGSSQVFASNEETALVQDADGQPVASPLSGQPIGPFASAPPPAFSSSQRSVLSSFGKFSFGATPGIQNLLLSRVASGSFENFGGALLGVSGQSALSFAVSGNHFGRDLTSRVLSTLPGPLGGISSQLFDQASGAVGIGSSSTSGQRSPSIASAVGQGLAAAVISSAVSTGLPIQRSVTPQGLSLSSRDLGAVNANRPAQFPFGSRSPF